MDVGIELTTSGLELSLFRRTPGRNVKEGIYRANAPNSCDEKKEPDGARDGHFPVKFEEVQYIKTGSGSHQTAEALAAAEVFFHGVVGVWCKMAEIGDMTKQKKQKRHFITKTTVKFDFI
ncbi:hypothetical protein MKO97_14910 [Flavobacterium sp. HJ-32-4]|nr:MULTISPECIES: hypothetical protein [unclassified Flavobacterium]UMY65768.1 hypothetical protein MKO97_14910 [Flavobacterium sp. HJ-32-4]